MYVSIHPYICPSSICLSSCLSLSGLPSSHSWSLHPEPGRLVSVDSSLHPLTGQLPSFYTPPPSSGAAAFSSPPPRTCLAPTPARVGEAGSFLPPHSSPGILPPDSQRTSFLPHCAQGSLQFLWSLPAPSPCPPPPASPALAPPPCRPASGTGSPFPASTPSTSRETCSSSPWRASARTLSSISR